MQKTNQQRIAILFTIFFMAIISVPSIIMSFDDTIDITCFYGENEEEEKEGLKLVFEFTSHNLEDFFTDSDNNRNEVYTSKNYPKPHLNLISPPPEFI
ncbi:hypothetical protein [uncultured Winogradskyella sp.]|uniref:hypothetical protein n=1 Tax=uncultured Winogradskyella sp. TaxID=395353 RepID=UPI002626FA68|nr:hypothetical protein [uncultured Winogradskyella sp.]